MNIAICDDNAAYRETLICIIKSISVKNLIKSITEFPSGESLLFHMQRKSFDLVFLDCHLEGMDGLATAKKIRLLNQETVIVAISDYHSYAIGGYEADVFRYILKADAAKKAESVIIEAYTYLEKIRREIYSTPIVRGFLSVKIADIMFVESLKHRVHIFLVNNDYYAYKKLDVVEKELKGFGFVRVHNSYLVNCRYIHIIKSNEVKLYNGTKLTVTKPHYKKSLDDYTLYITGEVVK